VRGPGDRGRAAAREHASEGYLAPPGAVLYMASGDIEYRPSDKDLVNSGIATGGGRGRLRTGLRATAILLPLVSDFTSVAGILRGSHWIRLGAYELAILLPSASGFT
jgi:hypothetical protein